MTFICYLESIIYYFVWYTIQVRHIYCTVYIQKYVLPIACFSPVQVYVTIILSRSHCYTVTRSRHYQLLSLLTADCWLHWINCPEIVEQNQNDINNSFLRSFMNRSICWAGTFCAIKSKANFKLQLIEIGSENTSTTLAIMCLMLVYSTCGEYEYGFDHQFS